jgi:DNA mismatch repair protein MutL
MMERRPIQIMPHDLAMKIAAGEVVERPASAVKELLDNALDAGADQIKIEIREAGLKLIRVSDNGCGIARDELSLAFTSHATSKISTLDDLQRLTTLGFRGEALPSIAAVARVEVQTRTAEETAGTRFQVEHGRVLSQGACSSPRGLRISISDLFANVPARRKFVRSLRAEGGQIAGVVMQYALAQPSVQLTLAVDGRVTFTSPGSGSLADAVAAVHGPDIVSMMRSLEAHEAGVRIAGLIGTPQLSRQNRTGIFIAVNGRPVQNRSLGFALEEAYSGFLMTGRHPIAAVHLTVPSDEVDVNIHPSKSEVRFARERDVHGALHRAVAHSLLQMRLEAREMKGVTDLPDEPEWVDAAPRPLLEEPVADAASLLPQMPVLRVFGQANAAFIIAEGPDGLYMIDQHAAHERILFDRLEEEMADGIALAQPLLEPATVDLAAPQMLALEDNQEMLHRMGFGLEPFGDAACLVRSIPVFVRGGDPGEMVREVLTELEQLPGPAAARERAMAAIACRAAVKAGQSLAMREMQELVGQLERTLRPSTCPHGRPTMIHLSHSQLEREFGRR